MPIIQADGYPAVPSYTMPDGGTADGDYVASAMAIIQSGAGSLSVPDSSKFAPGDALFIPGTADGTVSVTATPTPTTVSVETVIGATVPAPARFRAYNSPNADSTYTAGGYKVKVTWVGLTGETLPSAEVPFNVAGGSQATIALSEALPVGVTGWNAYLTVAGGAANSEHKVAAGPFTGSAVTFTSDPALTSDVPPVADTMNPISLPAGAPIIKLHGNIKSINAPVG